MTKKIKKSISLGVIASMFVIPSIASAATFSEGYYDNEGVISEGTFVPENGYPSMDSSGIAGGRFVDPGVGPSKDLKGDDPYNGKIPKHLEGKTVPDNKNVENHWYFGKDGVWHKKEGYKEQDSQQKKQYQQWADTQRQIEARNKREENILMMYYRKLSQLVDKLIREIDSFNSYLKTMR